MDRKMKALVFVIFVLGCAYTASLVYRVIDLGPTPMHYVKLEFSDAYTRAEDSYYRIHIDVTNIGDRIAEIDLARTLYNGKLASEYSGAEPVSLFHVYLTLDPIETARAKAGLTFILPKDGVTWASKANVEIRIVTSFGQEYPTSVTLP